MATETSSDNLMELATVDTLNQLTASQVSLLLLRLLSTSDLAFHYMLFKGATIQDILDVSMRLIVAEAGNELTEAEDLASNMKDYVS